MKKIVIGDIVSRAWDLAVKHWPLFVLLSIFNSILRNFIVDVDADSLMEAANLGDSAAFMEAYATAISFNPVKGIIAALLIVYLAYVLLNLYVNAYKNGRPYESLSEAFRVDFNQLAIFFCVELCYGIIVGIGTCACILPGIWIGVRLWYAPLLAATQGASFTEAFKRSWEMTRGNFWNLFLMGLTMAGIALLGFCACFVGIFFAEVVTKFMLIVSFFVLNASDEPQAAEPTGDYVEVE